MSTSLASATALRSLALRLEWSEEVAALMDLYCCQQAHAEAAAHMLRGLPQLSSIALGIHLFWGIEASEGYSSFSTDRAQALVFSDWSWMEVPPLGAISALTELHIDGAAGMPPDWRQLSSLLCLRVTHNVTWAAPSPEDWGWGSFD
ncbi:hypothetical protein ABPG75_009997 [Micractinium tetrahymenae]